LRTCAVAERFRGDDSRRRAISSVRTFTFAFCLLGSISVPVLVVTFVHIPAAVADYLVTNGIQFVNEDDGRVFLLGERERISDELCTVTDEHLDQLWAGQLQECRLGLCGTSPGQQRLASTGRTIQQHT